MPSHKPRRILTIKIISLIWPTIKITNNSSIHNSSIRSNSIRSSSTRNIHNSSIRNIRSSSIKRGSSRP